MEGLTNQALIQRNNKIARQVEGFLRRVEASITVNTGTGCHEGNETEQSRRNG